ncbi:hypothetical protein FI667_g11223, partial [Globisporangium splendens]
MKSSKEKMDAGRNTSLLRNVIMDLPQQQQCPEYLERQPMQRHSKAYYSQNFVCMACQMKRILFVFSPVPISGALIQTKQEDHEQLVPMLALKAFAQESMQDLDTQQLQLLSETLRIDLRGCDDRRDIERIVTGLICLDQDTSLASELRGCGALFLGVFLSWLRASDRQHGVLATKTPFCNAFVPTIAPREHSKNKCRPQKPSISCISLNQQQPSTPEDQVKDHHLDEEIDLRLAELQDLERDFKAAERLAHTGVPTFEKMKQFLMKLTLLRAKEEETRRFFIKQNALLKKQRGEMRDETLHTRAQLDFFVEGFANLRHRHDALLEKSTRMHAESEMAQQIFLSMSAHESHLAAIMAHTLNAQVAKNSAQQEKLDAAEAQIRELEEKQKELLAQISQLKQAHGDARKDANCYKRQLRKRKQKLANMESENGDCGFFRDQTISLRQSFVSLLGYLRGSVLRDTKSPKQVLSKEALRIIHQALSATASPPAKVAASQENEQKQNPPATASTASGMESISESNSSELYPETISS